MISQSILYSMCPCGSGKKFKFCCYQQVRNELSGNPTQSEVTDIVRSRHRKDCEADCPDREGVISRDRYIEMVEKGLSYYKDKDLDSAERVLKEAVAARGDLVTAYNSLLFLSISRGDFIETEKRAAEIIRLFPEDSCLAYGVASELCFFRGDIQGALDNIEKAEGQTPYFVGHARQVCAAIAHFMDHERMLRYIEKTGYAGDPGIELYRGIAFANTGRIVEATRSLHTALESDNSICAGTVIDEINEDGRPSAPGGQWLYFTVDNYPCFEVMESLVQQRDKAPVATSPEAVAEFVEVEFISVKMSAAEALKVLKDYPCERGARLIAAIEKSHATALSDLLDEPEIIDDPETPLALPVRDLERYNEALKLATKSECTDEELETALDILTYLHAEYPEEPELAVDIAHVLEKLDRPEEAGKVYEECFAAHPDYLFAAAGHLSNLVTDDRLDEAEKLVNSYILPRVVHFHTYIAWKSAMVMFFLRTGAYDKAGAVMERIEELRNRED